MDDTNQPLTEEALKQATKSDNLVETQMCIQPLSESFSELAQEIYASESADDTYDLLISQALMLLQSMEDCLITADMPSVYRVFVAFNSGFRELAGSEHTSTQTRSQMLKSAGWIAELYAFLESPVHERARVLLKRLPDISDSEVDAFVRDVQRHFLGTESQPEFELADGMDEDGGFEQLWENSLAGEFDESEDTGELPEEIQDLLHIAREEIAGCATALQKHPSDRKTAEAKELSLAHIDNLAMVVESLQLPAFAAMQKQIEQNIQSWRHAVESGKGDVEALVQWIDDFIAYIQNPDEQHLHRLLPDTDQTDDVEMATDSGGDSDTLQWEYLGRDSDQYEIVDALPADPYLAVLVEEIHDLTPQIESAWHDGFGQGINISGANRYLELLSRIASAAESIHMQGLVELIDFVQKSVAVFQANAETIDENRFDVLKGWLPLVMAYLRNIENEQTYLDIVDYLEDPRWPQPVNGVHWRHLFTLLAEGHTTHGPQVAPAEERPAAGPEDVSLILSEDANESVIEAFLHEAPHQCAELSQHIDQMVRGREVRTNVEAAQRLAHTLKGSANLINLKGVANLAHPLEDIFEWMMVHHVTDLPVELSHTLQDASDCLETMVDAVLGMDEAPPNALGVLQSVLNWTFRLQDGYMEGVSQGDLALTDQAYGDTDETIDGRYDTGQKDAIDAGEFTKVDKQAAIRVPTSTLDEMFRLVGEASITLGQTQEKINRIVLLKEQLKQQERVMQERRYELEDLVDVRGSAAAQRRTRVGGDALFDSLEMDHYDEMYSTVHGYIEAVTDYRTLSGSVQNEIDALDELVLGQKRLHKDLERTVMSTRMIPVETLVSRLQRSVRQAARATGKQVELQLDGTDLMVASEILHQLADPLMHLLRNAVDHGIEPPDMRIGRGKAAQGRIRVAFIHDGNHMLVKCTDDGAGLNYERIQDVARSKGLLEAGQSLSHEDLAQFIMAPGFSTRDNADHLSGRGIGMDVVYHTIQKLKGTLKVADAEDGGTEFIIRLPLQLITSHCLVVRADEQDYAVPSDALAQIVPPGSGRVLRSDKNYVYESEDRTYTLKSLSTLLNTGEGAIDNTKTVLLTRTDKGLQAVAVDYAVSSYDLVIKKTGRFVQNLRGVTGVSILGNGELVPVLDLYTLLQKPVKTFEQVYRRHDRQTPSTNANIVLIADDSLSVRTALTELVQGLGFEVVQARDGVEALNLLEQRPALALIDLEMPRMNGLELTRHIRSQSEIPDLPVIMITSRSQRKHREQAEQVGADVYVTKPYVNEKLADTITQFLETPHDEEKHGYKLLTDKNS